MIKHRQMAFLYLIVAAHVVVCAISDNSIDSMVENNLLAMGNHFQRQRQYAEAFSAFVSGFHMAGRHAGAFYSACNDVLSHLRKSPMRHPLLSALSEQAAQHGTVRGRLLAQYPRLCSLDSLSLVLQDTWHEHLGEYAPKSQELLTVIAKLLLRQDSLLALDVGAGSGSFSLLPLAHPQMRVVAFEAVPLRYEVLNRNVALNGLQQLVWTVNGAVGQYSADEYTLADVFLDKSNSSWYLNDYTAAPIRTRLFSIDDFATQHALAPIGFIRFNADALLLDSLHGAVNVLQRDGPTLLIVTTMAISLSFEKSESHHFLVSLGYSRVVLDFENSLYVRATQPEFLMLSAWEGGVISKHQNTSLFYAVVGVPDDAWTHAQLFLESEPALEVQERYGWILLSKNPRLSEMDVSIVSFISEQMVSAQMLFSAAVDDGEGCMWVIDGRCWTAPELEQAPLPKETALTVQHKRELNENGFTILRNVLTSEEADYYRDVVLDLLSKQKKGSTRVFFLERHEELGKLLNNKLTLSAFEYMLGKNFKLSSWTANVVFPGNPLVNLHIDHPLYHLPQPRPLDVLVANSIWCLQDFTKTNGATRVIPGSHISRRMGHPGGAEDPLPWPEAITVEANKGDVIILNGAIWHGATGNSSPSARVALLGFMAAQSVLTQRDETTLHQQGIRKIWPSDPE